MVRICPNHLTPTESSWRSLIHQCVVLKWHYSQTTMCMIFKGSCWYQQSDCRFLHTCRLSRFIPHLVILGRVSFSRDTKHTFHPAVSVNSCGSCYETCVQMFGHGNKTPFIKSYNAEFTLKPQVQFHWTFFMEAVVIRPTLKRKHWARLWVQIWR